MLTAVEKHGELPYGELDHGKRGVLNDYTRIYGVDSLEAAEQLVFLTSLMRSRPIVVLVHVAVVLEPSKCHNHVLNSLRKKVG